MWEREQFSIMFPAAPYFFSSVIMAVVAMLGAAGQRGQELLGVSAGSHYAAISSLVDEGLENASRQADSA
jgi:hypothetical protein